MQTLLGNRSWCVLAVVATLLVIAASSQAQDSQKAIRIRVDLSEAPRRIFHARLDIPAAPGPLILEYPQWIPGEHGPTGPIADVAGLKFTSGGKALTWRRDDVDMYALHIEVPAGASSVEVALDYLAPSSAAGFSASPPATAQLAVLEWNLLVLYPQGARSDGLMYAPSLRMPAGWRFGTALEVSKESGGEIEFKPVTLTTLVDSPVIAGAHFRAVPLSPGETPAHQLNLAADSEAAVNISAELAGHYRQLVAEAGALFGARHYRHYDFLLALSDHLTPLGLEHHQSSDNRAPERMLLEPELRNSFGDLLPHEFTHSWNGKYRRPEGLATPNFQQPMRGELLWVYEGLTQYLGQVLATRSGLWTPELYRESIAWTAGYLDQRPGRTWRPLLDTAVAAQILYGSRNEWAAWRRSVDFYDESNLIWLEADTIIGRESQGQRSLDDFCRRFHGTPGKAAGSDPSAPAVVTYTFDEVVATLNDVAAYDWKHFFTLRLNSTGSNAPLAGLAASGWKLVFTDVMNEHLRATQEANKLIDARFSLGIILRHDESDKDDGAIIDVIPGTPVAQAGIAPGMRLVAVNGQRWSPEVLREALREAKGTSEPMELLVENAGFYKTYRCHANDGERYPHLVREPSRPDWLEQSIRPHAGRTARSANP